MLRIAESTMLETLSEPECRRLLACGGIGRIGIATDEVAYVLPVNYAMLDDLIVFRTARGSTFDRLVRNRSVTFEIDHLDPGYHAGWSVVGFGVGEGLEGVVDPNVLHALHLRPWGFTAEPGWIGILLHEVTGRRVVHVGISDE